MDNKTSEDGHPTHTARQFDELVRNIVADGVPRLFAVVYEQATRRHAEVAAYGMAFRNRAELVTPDGADRMTSASPEQAAALLEAGTGDKSTTVRLVWLDASAHA